MNVRYCMMNESGIGQIREERPSTEVVISATVGAGGANRHADVLAVQTLLNRASAAVGVPAELIAVDGLVGPETSGAIRQFQKAQFGFSDGRVDPVQKTINRLNAIASGSSTASGLGPGPLGLGSSTPAATTPKQAALAATPLGQMWTNKAIMDLSSAKSILLWGGKLFPLGGETLLARVNTHFHLDKPGPSAPSKVWGGALDKLIRVFGLIQQTLNGAATYFQEGSALPASLYADAPMGGFNLPGTPYNRITFRTEFVNCGPNCRAAMLVHECAHFVGGINEIKHFATEFPVPDGKPQDGSTRNYKNLNSDEALCNASSYAAYAIHAGTGFDLRYGLNNKTL